MGVKKSRNVGKEQKRGIKVWSSNPSFPTTGNHLFNSWASQAQSPLSVYQPFLFQSWPPIYCCSLLSPESPTIHTGPSLKLGLIFVFPSPSCPGPHLSPPCGESFSQSFSHLVLPNPIHYPCLLSSGPNNFLLQQTLVSSLYPSNQTPLRSQSVVFLKHGADPQNLSTNAQFGEITLRIVSASPALLSNLEFLSPPDDILHPSLCTLMNHV